jgi:vacuolar-type H+-ATPase subunit I/STV1
VHGPVGEGGEPGASVQATSPAAPWPATPAGPFVWLGYAGLLPPLALLGMLVLHRGTLAAPMLVAVAIGYAALIFSFLGGVWWGLLAGSGRRVGFASAALSVMPSLVALVLVFATTRAPVIAPLMLAGFVALSPVVDRELARHGLVPRWWLPLRLVLSVSLAGLTAAAVLVAAG